MRCSRFTHSQDTMANKQDYVDLGLSCADICKALERGMGEKELGDVSKSVCDAINQLTTWVEPAIDIPCSSPYHSLDCRTVAEIQEKILKRSGRHRLSRFFHSRDDKDAVAAWKSDLNRILHVFNVCQNAPASSSLTTLLTDRASCEHSHHHNRYTSGRIENSRGHGQPE